MAGITRRTVAAFPLTLLGWRAAKVSAASLPAPRSLAEALAAALRIGEPLVVMASLDGCPFCTIVRERHLAPLQRDSGLPVVQLDLRTQQAVLDFGGVSSTHDQVLRRWGVQVTPTVLFFGTGAREAAPRLVGASIPDFYGAYLEQRLTAARAGLR
jgi:hypothetical protein